jgi:hypothetical protein
MKSLNTRAINTLKKLTLGLAVAACITGFTSVAAAAQDAPKTIDSAARLAGGKIIPLSQDDRKATESYLGKGVVGKAVSAPVIDDAGQVFGLHTGTWTGRITSGKNKGKSITWSLGPSQGTGSSGSWRGTLGDSQVIFLSKTADGHIVEVSDIEHAHGALTHYTPPEPMVEKGMKPGNSRKMDIAVKVYDAKNSQHLEHSGNLKLTYTYVGAYEITVPAGKFDALLFKWHYTGKVGPASIDDAVYRFFAPGVGAVARLEFKHISAVLIYHDNEKWGAVLTDHK